MEAQLQETFAAYRRPTLLVTHNIEEAYRLGNNLLVLSRGHVAAFGPKEELFWRPPNLEVARLTGCKNLSRARAISENTVEALDWGCRLRVAQRLPETVGYVGIRAHHVDVAQSSVPGGAQENTFPCWLARSSETPFRITLYLRLRQPTRELDEAHAGIDLQAEVFKEKWGGVRDRPMPWQVRLSPDALFVVAD
jgi:molybdate transport system permease protein